MCLQGLKLEPQIYKSFPRSTPDWLVAFIAISVDNEGTNISSFSDVLPGTSLLKQDDYQ